MPTIYKWTAPIVVSQARYDVLIMRAGYFATATPYPGDGTTQVGSGSGGGDNSYADALVDDLSGVTNPAEARINLGLGNAATKNIGTVANTVAEGNDSRITGAAQKTSNLSDLNSAATARTNLGLGNSATRAVGAGPGQVLSADTVTTKGDLLIASANGTITRLPAGLDGQALTANAADAVGAKWAALPADSSRVWNLGDQICVPASASNASFTATTLSGQPMVTGGPGMMVPAGKEVQGVSFISNTGSTTLTAAFAFLAIPDPTGAPTATIVAVSNNYGATSWGSNAVRKFSFRSADGGSGYWTPSVDSPVYAAIVQVATTTSSLRGISAGNVFTGAMLTPKLFAVVGAAGGMTTPPTVGTVVTLSDTQGAGLCRLSSTYN